MDLVVKQYYIDILIIKGKACIYILILNKALLLQGSYPQKTHFIYDFMPLYTLHTYYDCCAIWGELYANFMRKRQNV